MVVFLIRHVHSAESNIPQKRMGTLPRPSTKDMYRPQPQVIPIEQHRLMAEKSDDDSTTDSIPSMDSHMALEGKEGIEEEERPQIQLQEVSKKSATMREMIQRVIRLDHVDRMIFRTALPLSAVFAIVPVGMALDLFWVNRLGDTLAVAGQAAANQVYNSAFWLFSFLPIITATLVSKSHASGDLEQTQDAVCQAMLFSLLIAITAGMLMFFKTSKALGSILKGAITPLPHESSCFVLIFNG